MIFASTHHAIHNWSIPPPPKSINGPTIGRQLSVPSTIALCNLFIGMNEPNLLVFNVTIKMSGYQKLRLNKVNTGLQLHFKESLINISKNILVC